MALPSLPHLATYLSVNAFLCFRCPNRRFLTEQSLALQPEEYPSDPDAHVEWHENKLKKLYKHSIGLHDDIVSYRKQLFPDAFTVQPLPTSAGLES